MYRGLDTKARDKNHKKYQIIRTFREESIEIVSEKWIDRFFYLMLAQSKIKIKIMIKVPLYPDNTANSNKENIPADYNQSSFLIATYIISLYH